jgi:hypothetical protein
VKCDEQRPSCARCERTGRKCDGYREAPANTVNHCSSLCNRPGRSLNTLSANSNPFELQALAFFKGCVADALTDPLDTSPWTHMVMQVVEIVPAVKHAAIAVSELYQGFGHAGGSGTMPQAAQDAALRQYNQAISHMVNSKMDHDIALLVCVLFVCTEFLSGNASGAITHVVHGSRLLTSAYNSRLAPVFRHLLVFPFFFARTLPKLPAVDDGQWHSAGIVFGKPIQAQTSLDTLAYQVVRLVRMTDYHRLGVGAEAMSVDAATEERRRLQDGLQQWRESFSLLEPATQTKAFHSSLRLLEVRWLVLTIWVDTCVAEDEMVYDFHQERFERIIELADMTHKSGVQTPEKFSFAMGYCPLLHFLVIKCRRLGFRLRALALLRVLSCDRESLWDRNMLQATGKRIVELEHGIEMPANLGIDDLPIDVLDATLPGDEKRIRDNMLEGSIEVFTDIYGARRMRQKICFLIKDGDGGLRSIQEWIALPP